MPSRKCRSSYFITSPGILLTKARRVTKATLKIRKPLPTTTHEQEGGRSGHLFKSHDGLHRPWKDTGADLASPWWKASLLLSPLLGTAQNTAALGASRPRGIPAPWLRILHWSFSHSHKLLSRLLPLSWTLCWSSFVSGSWARTIGVYWKYIYFSLSSQTQFHIKCFSPTSKMYLPFGFLVPFPVFCLTSAADRGLCTLTVSLLTSVIWHLIKTIMIILWIWSKSLKMSAESSYHS